MSVQPSSPVKTYFDFIKNLISSNPFVQQSAVIRERVGSLEGFIQITACLIKGKTLDVFEYYTMADGVTKYRYNLMDDQKDVLARWDNAPHHPEISTHPHHLHLPEKIVESKKPSLSYVLIKLSDFI
nr:DUF6516 family protein [Candidatus Sigynarchaeum springense]